MAGATESTAVFELNMHCHECAAKVINYVKRREGVEEASADVLFSALTVTGTFDPCELRGMLAAKTKKKVWLLSLLPSGSKGSDDPAAGVREREVEPPAPAPVAPGPSTNRRVRFGRCVKKIKEKMIAKRRTEEVVAADTGGEEEDEKEEVKEEEGHVEKLVEQKSRRRLAEEVVAANEGEDNGDVEGEGSKKEEGGREEKGPAAPPNWNYAGQHYYGRADEAEAWWTPKYGNYSGQRYYGGIQGDSGEATAPEWNYVTQQQPYYGGGWEWGQAAPPQPSEGSQVYYGRGGGGGYAGYGYGQMVHASEVFSDDNPNSCTIM